MIRIKVSESSNCGYRYVYRYIAVVLDESNGWIQLVSTCPFLLHHDRRNSGPFCLIWGHPYTPNFTISLVLLFQLYLKDSALLDIIESRRVLN